ncbi:MAG: sulfite exporter TauE/SafE family protein [Elainellaceae cyanobacterium]
MISLVILGLASFVAWFFSMLAGGGSPFILIPLVTVMLGSQAVAPVITTGMLAGNAQRVVFFWRDVDVPVTLWHLPGAIAGAVVGGYVLTFIHLEWLQLLMGGGLILMVVSQGFGKKERSFPVQTWHFLPYSFFYAFLSALLGSTGPIMNPVYLNYGLDKERMIATKSTNVLIVHIAKVLTYLALGTLTQTYLAYGLLIGTAAIPANYLGKLILDRMSSQQFRQAVLGFVAISGAMMLWEQRNLLLIW